MDERQKLNAGNAAMIALFVAGLAAIGFTAWDYLAHKSITQPAALVVALVAWGLFYLFYQVFGGEAPKDLLGRERPTGNSAAERAARRRSYAVDALLLAGAMTALGLGAVAMGDATLLDGIPLPLTGPALIAVASVISFVASAAIFYVLDLAIGEASAKAHERRFAGQD